jgi:hypothetical protein
MATNPLAAPAAFSPIARFRDDLRRRFPDGTTQAAKASDHLTGREVSPSRLHRLEKLPPEIGVLLIVMGVTGLLLPGPVGSPFLVAGGVALWPSAFRKVEDWLQRASPRLFEEGIRQMERFVADLERRYPGSTR